MSAIALGQIHVAFQARGQEIRDGTSGKVKPRKAFWALRGFVKWKFGGRASIKIIYFSVYIQYINFPSRIRYQQKYQHFLLVAYCQSHSRLTLGDQSRRF